MVNVKEAQEVLRALGLPNDQQNEISSLTLIVLSGLKPSSNWQDAAPQALKIHDMMAAMKSVWGKEYAENTRETVRRQVLHQFEQARVVDRNPNDTTLATNSPRTHYALTEQALGVIRARGTATFPSKVQEFKAKFGSLVQEYKKERASNRIPVELPEGIRLLLSPGAHNTLQKNFIEGFCSVYAPDAKVIYLGDTAKKDLYKDKKTLENFGLKLTEHEKMPDIILLDEKRRWLFLVEVVTSHGPVSPKREKELREMFASTGLPLVFVTAFPDASEFK